MNVVSLVPDGRLTTESGAAVQDPLACLGHRLVLEGQCTLRTLFRMFETYDVLVRLGEFYPVLLEQ